MEERKQKEIEYYDKHAEKLLTCQAGELTTDFEGFDPQFLSSYRYLYRLLKNEVKGKKVLDYGCGNGNHAIYLASQGGKIIAGDLSQQSLAVAEKKARGAGVADCIDFVVMDCEKTDFLDNEFDIIFDGGTFSSIDIKKAFPELARILKSGGVLIGIETYGHNPLANLNRKLNVKSGKRTAWAASHIFNQDGFNQARNYFGKIEVKYFHLFSWMLFGLLDKPWGRWLLSMAEFFDRLLLKVPFFQKYAFKVVFKFSNPIKTEKND